MDALAVITTVYNLVQSISKWLEDRTEREATVHQISTTITSIQQILQPLHDSTHTITIEPQTLGVVKSIGRTLKGTQEHLFVWQDQRSRRILATLSPSSVVKQLREDERQLSQQLILLLTSLAVVYFVENRNNRQSVLPITTAVHPRPISRQPKVLDSIGNKEVRDFWNGYVGAEVRSLDLSRNFELRSPTSCYIFPGMSFARA